MKLEQLIVVYFYACCWFSLVHTSNIDRSEVLKIKIEDSTTEYEECLIINCQKEKTDQCSSVSVKEGQDVRLECKKRNEKNENNAIVIKWYKYNCSNWREIIFNSTEDTELQTKLLNTNGIPKNGFDIKNVSHLTDPQAYKCIACFKEECSESIFYIRLSDRYAILWPLIGIILEVIAICLIIFLCELRKPGANYKDECEDELIVNLNGVPQRLAA